MALVADRSLDQTVEIPKTTAPSPTVPGPIQDTAALRGRHARPHRGRARARASMAAAVLVAAAAGGDRQRPHRGTGGLPRAEGYSGTSEAPAGRRGPDRSPGSAARGARRRPARRAPCQRERRHRESRCADWSGDARRVLHREEQQRVHRRRRGRRQQRQGPPRACPRRAGEFEVRARARHQSADSVSSRNRNSIRPT